MPFGELVIQAGDYCYLSVDSKYRGPYTIGVDILRSVYLVVALKGREVAIAQAVTFKKEIK